MFRKDPQLGFTCLRFENLLQHPARTQIPPKHWDTVATALQGLGDFALFTRKIVPSYARSSSNGRMILGAISPNIDGILTRDCTHVGFSAFFVTIPTFRCETS
ncbi:hypothetical protein N7G274_004649 [Stereocaulon virgatum]|uniref:Uncharacterized protein n=1 Tax=Stereocaulon virgatum TaxID=373712 RepID=A0ABR4ADV4_9LECA